MASAKVDDVLDQTMAPDNVFYENLRIIDARLDGDSLTKRPRVRFFTSAEHKLIITTSSNLKEP